MENENVPQKGQDADRKEMTADLYTLVIDVLKNLWAAVAVGIAAALLVYVAASLRYVPQYRSSTTFVVSARGTSTGAYANVSAASQKAEVFQTVLDSQVLKTVWPGNWDFRPLRVRWNISIVPETNLLSVSVTAEVRRWPIVCCGLCWKYIRRYPGALWGMWFWRFLKIPTIPRRRSGPFRAEVL